MLNVFILLLNVAFFSLVTAGVLLTIFRKRLVFEQRVESYLKHNINKEVSNDSVEKNPKTYSLFFTRYWNAGVQYLNRKISNREKKKLDILLRDAGYPFKSAIDFRLFQILLAAGLGVPVFLFLAPFVENKTMGWLLSISLAFLGFRYPMFYLAKRKTKRIKDINKSMPDFFDMVNLLLEAGMGLDLAISTVAKQTRGPLAEEFFRALEDMKLGKSRRDAFYDLRKRVPSDSFQSVMSSLIQADYLGIGMAKVIGNITTRIREQRREAAREQAMKAPVKMLFPMLIFIFPSLFIVVLGPMAIKLLTGGLGG